MNAKVYSDPKNLIDDVTDYVLTLDPQRDFETLIVTGNNDERKSLVHSLHEQYYFLKKKFDNIWLMPPATKVKQLSPRTMEIIVDGESYKGLNLVNTLVTVNVFRPLTNVNHHVQFATHEAELKFFQRHYEGWSWTKPTWMPLKNQSKSTDAKEQQKLCL